MRYKPNKKNYVIYIYYRNLKEERLKAKGEWLRAEGGEHGAQGWGNGVENTKSEARNSKQNRMTKRTKIQTTTNFIHLNCQ